MTTDNLRKRKVVCISWCYLCKETGEDVDHHLLHGSLATKLRWAFKLYIVKKTTENLENIILQEGTAFQD